MALLLVAAGIHTTAVAAPSSPPHLVIEVREYSGQSPDGEATKNQINATRGGRQLPLSIGGGNGNSVPYDEKDDSIVIPLWGEEIGINKRMVKLGEFVVKNTKTPRRGNLM